MTAPMQPDLNELAARVEGLEGHDVDTLEAVLRAFGWRTDATGRAICSDGSYHYGVIPNPLTSLDAAMKLVPAGWFTSDYHAGPSGGHWWKLSVIRDGDTYYTSVAGIAATPALALTAAALRALAAKEPSA